MNLIFKLLGVSVGGTKYYATLHCLHEVSVGGGILLHMHALYVFGWQSHA